MKRHNLYNICLKCSKKIKTTMYRRTKGADKYCSSKCYWESGQKRPLRMTGTSLHCSICKKFVYSRKCENRKYCSHKCYAESLKGKPTWSKGKKFPERSGKNHPRFIEKTKDSSGYILIHVPFHPYGIKSRKYVFEHRLVVEKIIGRYLLPEEIVHHEGERDDNRPEMLIAFTHKRYHNMFHAGKNIKDCYIIFDGRKIKPS